MVPVSTHVMACYHSALAATLLSVWAPSVFKESQTRQAVYEEHDSESTLYIHPTSSFNKYFLPQHTRTMLLLFRQIRVPLFLFYSGFSLKCFFWPRLAECKNCLFTFLMEKRKLAEFTTALTKLFHCWSQEANSHLPQHEKYL